MELFEKERRGIYVYFKSFKDLSKLEKYGNFISYSKRGRYACIYVDENRMDTIHYIFANSIIERVRRWKLRAYALVARRAHD